MQRTAALALLGLCACTGAIATAPASRRAETAPAGATPVCPVLGSSPIRRLTAFEYDNTVRDLLGDDSHPGDAFPAEVGGNGFGNDANGLGFSRLLIEQEFLAAGAVAARAVADDARFRALIGCDPRAVDERCVAAFVDRFGLRAYRRPLEPGERERLLALYRDARRTGDLRAAVEAVLRAFLQAPQFLYRVERGTPVPGRPGVYRLGPHEIATRLSYLLWASTPDEALLAAARDGRLATREEVLAQAQRLLGDARARAVTTHFHRLAFRLVGMESLSKGSKQHPRWVNGIGPRLAAQTDRFIDHVVWEGAGDLGTILTAPYTFMDAELARFQGVDLPDGPGLQMVSLDARRAAGFLTQPGPMALLTPGAHTNPVKRGFFVRDRLLCRPPPSPPPSLNVQPPKIEKTATTRASFEDHRMSPACSGCHRLMDPIGFAFEHYDGTGLWRDTDNGHPIDTSGDLEGADVAGPFDGAPSLMNRLAGSAEVRACYEAHWFQFAFGRGRTPADACTLAALDDAATRAGGKVRDLVVALTQSDAFYFRTEASP